MGIAPSRTMVSAEEIAEAFNYYDNDAGVIEEAKFEKLVQALGGTVQREALGAIVASKGEGGKISCAAIQGLWESDIQSQQKGESELEEALKVFDNKGNNLITINQFKMMMSTVGGKLTDSEYALALSQARELSQNADGSKCMEDDQEAIDYKKFMAAIL